MTEETKAVVAEAEERPFSALELMAESEGLSVRAYARTLPAALAMMLDDQAYDRIKQLAGVLSKAEGVTPSHLLGKPEACFAVVSRAITWKLDPWAVANATYQTPGGRVGFEGKLVHAILERSGKFEGAIRFEHFGDWSKLAGKFVVKENQRGGKYPAPTWTQADATANGLGVKVVGKVRGEVEPREWSLRLDQCFPLNSTLWATDPATQICYTAVRRFAHLAAPSLLMGAPFEEDPDPFANMRDVTPAPARPQPADHKPKAKPKPTVTDAVIQEERPAAHASTEAVERAEAGAGATAQAEVEEPASASGAGGAGPTHRLTSLEAEGRDMRGEPLENGDLEPVQPAEDAPAAEPAPAKPAASADDLEALQRFCDGYKAEIAEATTLDLLAIVEKDWKEWRATAPAQKAPDGMLAGVSTALVQRKVELTPRRQAKR